MKISSSAKMLRYPNVAFSLVTTIARYQVAIPQNLFSLFTGGTRIMLLQHGTRRVLYVCNWHVNLSEKRGNGDQDHENVIEEAYE
jgi:hypothetical protein